MKKQILGMFALIVFTSLIVSSVIAHNIDMKAKTVYQDAKNYPGARVYKTTKPCEIVKLMPTRTWDKREIVSMKNYGEVKEFMGLKPGHRVYCGIIYYQKR